jgi:hypothetical protein
MKTSRISAVPIRFIDARFAQRGLGLLLLALLAAFLPVVGDNAPSTQPGNQGRGFTYFNDRAPEGPWSIHVFKVERSHGDLEFVSTIGKGETLGMATVSEQLRTLSPDQGQPVGAVNGDFYDRSENYWGRPRDLQIHCGELVSSPRGHTCFWVDPAGNPCMTNVRSRLRVIWPDETTTPVGLNEERKANAAVLYTTVVGASTRTRGGLEMILERGTNTLWLPLRAGQRYSARVREVRNGGDSPLSRDVMVVSFGPKLAERLPEVAAGARLQIATETTPDLTGVNTAIGGGPTLLRDGKAMEWSGILFRHPRTAVGWNKDFIFLVEVDGRQSGLSVGMTLPELAVCMLKLGCEQAMNLDGGGSATLWAVGNVMNSPCEGRERPAPNALVVVQKPAHSQ